MSFLLVGAAISIGTGMLISGETSRWKRLATNARKQNKYNEIMGIDEEVRTVDGLFSKDDLMTGAGELIGSVPVVGSFGQKAFYDGIDGGKKDVMGQPLRQTGSWGDAGIDAGIDVAKLALQAVPLLGQTAAPVVDAAATVLDTVVDAAAPVLDTVVDAAAPVLDTVVDTTLDVAPGLWEAGQTAINSSKDFLKDPLIDTLGKAGGEYAFKTIGDVPVGAALGAAANPDDPGRGAATGAFTGAASNVLDLGFDGLDSFMPDATPETYGVEDLGRTAIDTAIGGAASPLVGMGSSAVYDALTPAPAAEDPWLKNPYGQGNVFDDPYGQGNVFPQPYGSRRRV